MWEKKQHWRRQLDVFVRCSESIRPCLIYIWCRTPLLRQSMHIAEMLSNHTIWYRIVLGLCCLYKCINDLPFPAKEQPKDESKPLPPKVKGISRFCVSQQRNLCMLVMLQYFRSCLICAIFIFLSNILLGLFSQIFSFSILKTWLITYFQGSQSSLPSYKEATTEEAGKKKIIPVQR